MIYGQIENTAGEYCVYLFDKYSSDAALLKKELSRMNIRTQIFEDLESGVKMSRKSGPDLLIFDPNQWGSGDLNIIKELRGIETLKMVPFLIITEMMTQSNIVRILDLGGDDILSRPVKIGEAVSRIRGLLRRRRMNHSENKENLFCAGKVEINLNEREIKSKRESSRLTSTEASLLKELAKRPGKVVSRQKLLESVWPDENIVEEQNLDVHISSIRKKIEENPASPLIILTVRGFGYKLNLDS